MCRMVERTAPSSVAEQTAPSGVVQQTDPRVTEHHHSRYNTSTTEEESHSIQRL